MLNYIIINNIIMTMPLSGTVISFSDLEAVFGGEHPINIDEYYLNASTGYTSGVTGIPNINSTISLDMFYSKSKPPTVSTPITTVHNAGTNTNAGAPNLVFGIKALQNIKIVGFDIKMLTTSAATFTCSIEFYYRIGLVTDANIHKSFTEYGWTKITSGTYTHSDVLITIPTDTFTPPFSLDINENVNVCIAIKVLSNFSLIAYQSPTGGPWTGTMGQTSSTETNVFEVKAGFASITLPTEGTVTSNRVFQGNIRYQLR
jgi:hypothetical protein